MPPVPIARSIRNLPAINWGTSIFDLPSGLKVATLIRFGSRTGGKRLGSVAHIRPPITRIKNRISDPSYPCLLIKTGMNAGHIRNPEYLPIDLETPQPMLWQVFLFQPEIGEVRQIAEYRLKPTVLRHDFAHARVLKLIHVKRQHRDVLRRARRRNGVKNRL